MRGQVRSNNSTFSTAPPPEFTASVAELRSWASTIDNSAACSLPTSATKVGSQCGCVAVPRPAQSHGQGSDLVMHVGLGLWPAAGA